MILIPDKDNDLAAAMEYVEDMAFYKEIEVLVVRPFILIYALRIRFLNVSVLFPVAE